jgi:hypothetical protein
MKYKFVFISFIIITCSNIFGQEKDQLINGKVSFVTSKNIYVKFNDTKNINIGDTLKFLNQKSPCLLVKNKSSNSVVCTTIYECDIKKGDEVYYNYSSKNKNIEKAIIADQVTDTNKDSIESVNNNEKDSRFVQDVKGRISVASYSTLSNIRDDRHRIMYRFSLNANHINGTGFSFESYLTYRQYLSSGENTVTRDNIFNVYDLSLRYDVDPTLSIVVGRKINNKISSVGAIDGLQVEKYFSKNYIGAIAGFRPDIFDYSFNSDLFEYGAYVGRLTDNINFYSQTSLGFIEQQNSGEIDRRYIYFQHSSTIMKKLNLFSSLELDLYNKVNDTVNNDIRLTNLYVSARYRFSRKFDLMVSYDSRKRILYYETFKSEIERLLDDDLARQGLRARFNVRPVKYLVAGISYSKRFQSDDQNKSDNLYGYISYSKVPGIGGGFSVNYNMNTSNYLESNILSLRYSRNLIKNKLNADFYYRNADFNYFNSYIGNNKQNYYGANLSYNINRKLMFSLSGEYSSSSLENNSRIYVKLVKRFYSNKKK